jgi:ABC-2 type transport system permease protein
MSVVGAMGETVTSDPLDPGASVPPASAPSRVERVFTSPPRAGWAVVARKEFADHLRSARFYVLLVILGLVAVGTTYVAADAIRSVSEAASSVPSIFLKPFLIGQDPIPAFVALVGFIVPVLGIAFGFDAVSGERSEGTLPRLVSQPIYRDDVINGKFAAGLATIGLILIMITLLIEGVPIDRLGVAPQPEDVVRLAIWILISVIYVGFWLAFATLCSVAFRRAATALLVAIGVWLVTTLFASLLVSIAAGFLSPAPADASDAQLLANAQMQDTLGRLAPPTLYSEATATILNPSVHTVNTILVSQLEGAIPTSPLSLTQSLLVVWTQIVAIVGLTVASFALAYVLFMRQEGRALGRRARGLQPWRGRQWVAPSIVKRSIGRISRRCSSYWG